MTNASDFHAIARDQAMHYGATLVAAPVTAVTLVAGGFKVRPEDGLEHDADYVAIAEGKGIKLSLALEPKRNE